MGYVQKDENKEKAGGVNNAYHAVCVFERDDGVLNLVDLSVHAIVSERSKNTVSGFALGIR